jgi:aspartate racemase
MTCIGIVGGLGVGATVHYYEKITAACKARGVVPDLVFNHADVDRGQGFVREGKLDEMGAYLAGFIDRLAAGGAEAVAIPAVTPHIAIAEIKAHTKVPLINIVDTIGTELRARKVKKVALFGTIFTMQGSLWGQMKDAEIVKPKPDEMDFIGKAYQRILDTQAADPADAARLREIAAELRRRDGVETILLAGTDLALMFDETSAGFPCIDVARLHIDAIVARLTV